MQWHVIVAAVLGGGLTALALLVVARVQRRRWRALEKQAPLAELSRRFRNWETGGVVLMLVAMYASWLVLISLAERATPSAALHHLGANAWHWAAVAFFAGNLIATWPTHVLYRWWMGPSKYAEFRAYQTRKFGYDSRPWLPVFYVVFGTATVLVAWLMLSWGVTFTGEGVAFQPFGSRADRFYRYDQVMNVGTIDSEDRRILVLTLDDGRRWTSEMAPTAPSPALVERIARTVSDHSGLPISRSLRRGPGG